MDKALDLKFEHSIFEAADPGSNLHGEDDKMIKVLCTHGFALIEELRSLRAALESARVKAESLAERSRVAEEALKDLLWSVEHGGNAHVITIERAKEALSKIESLKGATA